MSHPPELEAIPTAGSLVGRHLIVREIAKGTFGPLYLARTQDSDGAVDTLARVMRLPGDLPPKDDQLIAEAIWDSANLGHDMVLRVADVVAGKGWVTLVHDYCAGSLLSSMHWRTEDLGGSFPSEVAARIALDVLEGLEQSRGLCESNCIPWRPGSIVIGSLYLCSDGRTRALDGQVMAAVMRSAQMRGQSSASLSVAAEMLDGDREPDERTDVFAVAVVLWQLLTGRTLSVDPAVPVADVAESVPAGTQVPAGLVQALHRALQHDPGQRQTTLRELAVELVMGAEKVATYEQVIEFAGSLLPYEVAFQSRPSAASQEPTPPAAPKVDASVTRSAAQLSADLGVSGSAVSPAPAVAQPTPRYASPFAPHLHPAEPSGAHEIPALPSQASQAAAAASASSDGSADAAPGSDEPSTVGDPATTTPSPGLDPARDDSKGSRLEQISWPDDERTRLAPIASPETPKPDKQWNVPPIATGTSASEGGAVSERRSGSHTDATQSRTSKSPEPAVDERDAEAKTSPGLESRREHAMIKQPEPTAKSMRRESARPGNKAAPASSTGHGSTKPTASVRPKAAKPVDVRLLAEELANAGNKPPRAGGLQVSATTLILGFSTTVLAVVLVMVLVLRQSSPSPTAVAPSQHYSAQPPIERASAQDAGTAPQPLVADRDFGQHAATPANKSVDAGPPPAPEQKVDRHKRPAKSGSNAANRAGDDEGPNDERASRRPRRYVPSDL
jgi:serine/threonine protein kinase